MGEIVNKTGEGIKKCLDSNISGVINAFQSILCIDLVQGSDFEIRSSNIFTSKFTTIACVPFAGPITGEFFLCLDKCHLIDPLIELSGFSEGSEELDELLYSTLQELANTAMGTTIPDVKSAFGVVTMLSPRLIEGSLRYPKTRLFCYTLYEKNRKFEIEAHLSFDLMEQDIGNVFEKLELESKLDDTGLYNKKFFQKTIEELEKSKRRREISIIFMDINRLKYVNDTFGHEAGDNYIQEACNIFKSACRPSDRCFRIGGDELVAVLFDCSLEGANQVVARISSKMNTTQLVFEHNGKSEKIKVNASIGVASTSEGIVTSDLVKIADNRMEENKRQWYVDQKLERRK